MEDGPVVARVDEVLPPQRSMIATVNNIAGCTSTGERVGDC